VGYAKYQRCRETNLLYADIQEFAYAANTWNYISELENYIKSNKESLMHTV
jgi:hypothetical protein